MKTKSLYKIIIKSNCSSSNNSYVIYLILPKFKNSYNWFLLNYTRFILEHVFIYKAVYKLKILLQNLKIFTISYQNSPNSSSLTDSNSFLMIHMHRLKRMILVRIMMKDVK